MSTDTRHNSGGSIRSKRRVNDAVDDDGRQVPAINDPSSKRQRVSRACDSCRSKKDKCDGAQPVCSTCASLSRPCTYRANPKKRGLPTGYIRTLELLWGLVFTKIQGSEEVVRTLLRAANIPSHLATMGKEAEGSDTLLSSWKNSGVLREIERLLTVLEQPEDEQERARAHGEAQSPDGISSETLEWHLPDPLVGPSPVRAPITPTAVRQTSTRSSATQTVPLEDQFGGSSGAGIPESVTQDGYQQLPSNPWPLLDIYFSYTQCWFPILEKHDILRTAFRHADDDQSRLTNSSGSGDQAALWAVLALASIQQSSITATRQLTDFSEDRPDPSQLYAKARSLVPGENGAHEIGHVQALLVLSLIKLGQQDWAAAWILVGHAVRIAQSLGLNNLPTSNAAEEAKTTGRSKHVFLGCFVLETLVAAQTGQVPSLRKSDITKIGSINEDGLEEWHPWEDQTGLRPVESSGGSFRRGPLHSLSTFNRLLSLMCILNDLCYWGQSTNSLSHLEALERQLQLWVSALPKSYRIDLQTVSAKPASPHIFALEMMYEAVATSISLQFSLQRSERGGLRRTAEGSKRLISLIQAYMETYSISATCPTFGMVLTLGLPPASARTSAPWVFEADSGIKQKLQSFSAHLATVWVNSGLPQARSESTTSPNSAAALHQGNTYRNPLAQNVSGSNLRVANLVGESRPRNLSSPESFLSPIWMRTSSNDENATLSLPTPAPSLNIGPGIEVSNPASQQITNHQHRTSVSGRQSGGPMLPDLATPFSATATGTQYQQTYNDPSLQFNSMVDLDGHETLRRPRIAPDLDALFDELASLDGTDRMDNQPEFMQNLGFIPEAGIPELYPYTGQTNPYFLAPTQPSLASPETTDLRRQSQITSDSTLNSRGIS
ncbi:fungal-specific transcription factor domain-containing protein [Aspergillus pseudoustus]|uniref:Fungal-specific transcription factor domain-containing protein n=1 Tax=Aspergillus pseudoustus TaxID=1810923 RepID=A0ABR4K073_9EURO